MKTQGIGEEGLEEEEEKLWEEGGEEGQEG